MWVHFQAGILLSLVLISFGFPKIEKFDFKQFRNPLNAKLGRVRDFRQIQAHLPVVVMQKLREHQARANSVTTLKTETVQTDPLKTEPLDMSNETTIFGNSDYDYNNTDWESDVDRVGPHHGFPMPKFLKHVSAKARKEFVRIVHNKNISRKEMAKQLDKWAKKQGPKIEKALHKYERELMKYLEALHQKTTKIVDQLPKAYEKVHRIVSDPNLSTRQVWEKLRALKLSRPVARSLRAVMFVAAHSGGKPLEEEEEDPNIDTIGVGLGYGPYGMNYGNSNVDDDTDE
ncbi:hypothetical protein WR25_17771 [Diploscapter pachys]|uniref:SXP/RAL-2 family protein Ani s 5-like cation-binding domain-containing protein n=1 Tax=Diploscapter pachys TaxID=2018661 RepID=A0A2A2LPK9_9BILA|nr:hypothetical protein WR25_17771 [Diploscapter pachys]